MAPPPDRRRLRALNKHWDAVAANSVRELHISVPEDATGAEVAQHVARLALRFRAVHSLSIVTHKSHRGVGRWPARQLLQYSRPPGPVLRGWGLRRFSWESGSLGLAGSASPRPRGPPRHTARRPPGAVLHWCMIFELLVAEGRALPCDTGRFSCLDGHCNPFGAGMGAMLTGVLAVSQHLSVVDRNWGRNS